MVTLLRKLKALNENEAGIYRPTISRETWKEQPEMARSIDACRFPLSGALDFIRKAGSFTSNKLRREYLIGEHHRLFGVYPNPGTSLEVVRTRCAYRLQYEGHRLTGTKPSREFLQNYKAIVGQFRDHGAFDGCTRDVATLGNHFALLEGVTTMAKVKAVKKVSKAAGKVSEQPEPEGPSIKGARMRDDGLPSPAAMIRWIAKRMDATTDQIRAALKELKAVVSDATIMAQSSRARKGVLPVPDLPPEMAERIQKAVPAAEATPAKEEKKPVKKVAKKVAVKKVVKKVAKKEPKAEGSEAF